ncbi:MAG: exodeoxyribonuclease VII large subunit, partial [Negativicutes bacterium]|nr:exodeoxyribonuclease VII large subunit [Negativicutes bacterium]
LIPDGVGELNLALEQLKEKLSAEGLFAAARKRPLPVFPRTVGIITSPTGAAIRDIITVAKRRHPGVSLVLYPVQVQGAEAPGQIVHAIEAMNRIGAADVIIVGRGGGSMEELWAFNDEGVVRAIAASGIPVVSAVGHETDYTLADFVADQRAATPSQAAELTVPDVRELARHVITLRSMLATSMHRLLDGRRKNIERLRESHGFNRPRDMLTRQHQTLDMLFNRLQEAQKKQLVESQHRFQVAAEKLAMLSPLAVLARGYSITRDKTGKILYRADETRPGENLEIILRHGSIEVNVNRIEEENHAKQAIERKSGA